MSHHYDLGEFIADFIFWIIDISSIQCIYIQMMTRMSLQN